jgi:hypothetical protein
VFAGKFVEASDTDVLLAALVDSEPTRVGVTAGGGHTRASPK